MFWELNSTIQAISTLPPALNKFALTLTADQRAINCSRRSDYELLLAQLNTFRDSLLLRNATQAEKVAEARVERDQEHSNLLATEATLAAFVQRGQAAKEGEQLAQQRSAAYMVKAAAAAAAEARLCKQPRPDAVQREVLQRRMGLVNRTRALLVHIDAALRRGHQEAYEAARDAALSAVAAMGLPPAQGAGLRAAVESLADPARRAAAPLAAAYAAADDALHGPARRCRAARAAARQAVAMRGRWAAAAAAVGHDSDADRRGAQTAENKLLSVESLDISAALAAAHSHLAGQELRHRLGQQIAALERVSGRLADGLARCGRSSSSGAAA